MTEAVVDAIAANRPNRIVNEGHRVIVRKATMVTNPVTSNEAAVPERARGDRPSWGNTG